MIRFFVLLVFSMVTGTASAKKRKADEGVMIELKVTDKKSKEVVPTATIRYPNDDSFSEVNELTGIWKASEIYLSDGSVHIFKPGTSLKLEVSAAGYVTQIVQYDIRRWRNRTIIQLEKMEIDDGDLTIPGIPFGRDQERDSSTGGAAN
jgi:hypothetical protein